MLDINRTVKLVIGALTDRETTWRSYLSEAGDWRNTAFLLTGPLIVVSAVVAYVLSLLTSDASMFTAFRPTLMSTLFSIVTGAIGAGVIAFVVSTLAGTFAGKNDFALGLAATTLAFVPGYIGQAMVWLPWIGGLLALGLGIFSLVQLWQIIPLYLEVPDSKRVVHFALSLIVTIVVMVIISTVLAPVLGGPAAQSPFGSTSQMDNSDQDSGMFGDMSRNAAIVADAEEDRYTPPKDGKLTEQQVREYVSVMQTVAEKRAAIVERMEKLAEKADEDDRVSVKDLGNMMSGMGEFSALATAEMAAVKANSGNWAEHRWVQESLLMASIQKDTNDTVSHNFSLYEQFAEQLEKNAGW
jgi:hypothetical protein